MTPENSSSILTCCFYSLHICTPANADSSTEKEKEGKVWKAGLWVVPPARSSSRKAGWLSSKEQRAEHVSSLLEFPSHTHMRDWDSAGKQLPAKIRMTNPQQRCFIYLF